MARGQRNNHGEGAKGTTLKDGTPCPCDLCRARRKEYSAHYRHTPQRVEYFTTYEASHKEQKAERTARWYAENYVVKSARDKARRDANPERERARAKAWREANPEKRREAAQRWREAHPDAARRWAAANPEKVLYWHGRRRALEHDVPYEWIIWSTVRAKALVDGEYMCYLCEKVLNMDTAQVDHYIPLAAPDYIENPGHVTSNLRYVHPLCNLKKSNHLPWELVLPLTG